MSAFHGAFIAANTGGLVLSITDSTPSGSDTGATASKLVTSNSTTVSVTAGGTGSYTYAWSNVDTWTNGPMTATTPTAASTTFSDTVADAVSPAIETWKCVVTDTGNGKTGIITCVVTLTYAQL